MWMLRPATILLSAATCGVLCGCVQKDPLRPGDVACLDYMTSSTGGGVSDPERAIGICHSKPIPDLSGDTVLQERFLAWNVPFQVNPRLDARLKFARRVEIAPDIGSNIPNIPITYTAAPRISVTEHDPTPVSSPADTQTVPTKTGD